MTHFLRINNLKFQKIHSENDLIQLDVIHSSVLIKTKIIDKDPLEGGLRKILNFGHTIGHALEGYQLNKRQISHGHAIALGMCAEAHISMKRKFISSEEFLFKRYVTSI